MQDEAAQAAKRLKEAHAALRREWLTRQNRRIEPAKRTGKHSSHSPR